MTSLPDGIAVNLYQEGRYRTEFNGLPFVFRQETDYPSGSTVRLYLEQVPGEEIDVYKRQLRTSEGVSFNYDRHCLGLPQEEIERNLAEGKPYVIRQLVPREGKTTFSDVVYGDITVDNDTLDDQILIKSDGLPTYNFANVIDDHLMKITHVVRGNEYLSLSLIHI